MSAERRLLPVIIIFLCCVIPSIFREFSDSALGIGWSAVWIAILLLYIYIIVHCSFKLTQLRKKYLSKS